MVLYRVSQLGCASTQRPRTYPVLDLPMPYGVMYSIAYALLSVLSPSLCSHVSELHRVPGPAAAANASSPMKKSRSSVPLFADRAPPDPVPPVRKEGLLATAGLPEPDAPVLPTPPLVAIAVGNTNEGESLPAKPACPLCQLVFTQLGSARRRTKLGETGTAVSVSAALHARSLPMPRRRQLPQAWEMSLTCP